MKVILINWWMIWKRMMLSISTTKFLIAELAVADYNFRRWTSKPIEYYSVNKTQTCKPPELHTIMKKCNGTGMVLKICETKNNVWKRHILSIQNSIDNHIKTTRIKPNFASLNNVHEPRNAEITAFLGSFLVAWQSNDNNFGNYFMCFFICRRRILFCIKKFYLSHVMYKFIIFIIINVEKFLYCRSQ